MCCDSKAEAIIAKSIAVHNFQDVKHLKAHLDT